MNKILHRRFVCTESEFGKQGHNKFWYISVYDNGDLETEYGRVGEPAKSSKKTFGSSEKALSEADKLIKKKTIGKTGKDGGRDSVYNEVEVASIVANVSGSKVSFDVNKKAYEEIAKGDSVIEDLVRTFVKTNKHNITSNTNITYDEKTGLFSTPVGVVGQSNIDKARAVLSNIRSIVSKDKIKDADPKIIDEYLRLIPQDTGRNRPTLALICPNIEAVEKQVSILDSLQASLDMINSGDDKPEDKKDEVKIWDITLKLNSDKSIVDMVNKLYQKTRQSMHACYNLNVSRIFEVNHHRMSQEFSSVGSKVGNIWQLWHGTRVGNILSILSKGMIIPPANASHCAGRMFGDGLYFSDQSTKSLNYAYGYWDGGSRDNTCYMFLVDVAMGNFYTPKSYTERLPKAGYDSTFAKANQSGVRNNEMIVYKTNQAAPRYLVEFK